MGYGNSALGEHLVNGDLLPVPRVELVENPAFGGAVVFESRVVQPAPALGPEPVQALDYLAPNEYLSLRRLPSPQCHM